LGSAVQTARCTTRNAANAACGRRSMAAKIPGIDAGLRRWLRVGGVIAANRGGSIAEPARHPPITQSAGPAPGRLHRRKGPCHAGAGIRANQAAAPGSLDRQSMRLGAVFVILCMLIIAGSAGAIAFLWFAFSQTEAVTVALAVLAVLGLYNVFATRGRGAAVGHQLADLSRGGADVARQVAEIGRRLSAMEEKVETALDRTRAVTDPITVEIGELGTLVKQLAETVAAQETSIAELARRPTTLSIVAPAASEQSATAPAAPPPEAAPAAAAALQPAADIITAPEASNQDAAVAAIRTAIDGNRVDLYLQPIVTLPQRKVRFYEAMSRLRSERGEVVRRLLLKNREIGLFCNLSGSTLADSGFPQFLEFLDANRAIAPSLVFEFTQSAVRAMGPLDHESLAALTERGFRFSMDNVTDMRIEPRELAGRGFRF